MGRVLLIGRLGARDLRHRPVQAVLPPRLAGGPPGDRARLQALACAPGVTGRSGTVSGRRRRAAGTGPHGGADGRRARPGTGPGRPAEGAGGQLGAAARRLASAEGAAIETKSGEVSLSQILSRATAVGILIALGVLAMTIGLIRSETASDLRTLTATGPAPSPGGT